MQLEKLTFGVGDRFAHQAAAQLRAFQQAADSGVDVVPVWNKSNREHQFVGSEPASVKAAAQVAVNDLGWSKSWYVDADHIQRSTVDPYLNCSDFFTIDVADFIGNAIDEEAITRFVDAHGELIGELNLPGMQAAYSVDREFVTRVARQYLGACQAAGDIYRYIADAKGEDNFIAEVSMDETDSPQTPPELMVILAALADQKIRLQTIAPKFTGRFNKGVDYVGDVQQFDREFNEDLAVIAEAIRRYQLPENLKLSVHSGSDKFSIYPVIREAIQNKNIGIHVKTAGTTWLEELIGLSEAGGDGLELAKEIYAYSLGHIDELCSPYASVIDIDPSALPSVDEVNGWDGPKLASTLRHIPHDPQFNPNVRQLLHVAFKVAAKAGDRYLDLLKANEAIVGEQVTQNLFDRHMKPLFIG
ncbi:tagaturonate epimerase family protein [Roseiconus lacunae]|uniref:Tagaturonate/fructuronate epimerase n=1 Tax=Roseiconus lacunae TaxID=2605694 RepID=A0ABT7PM18_9BACT|nr:tagaturonate epimerase family protein [Roseiconus lacunae]MCD0457996.1 tagaturonate epimerase family protein [Roseiconus lacunae]MDM4017562.1 tagaturonate epimerase family protein [Roseiconus lacunae]WRQ48369.1 tagaturonate epimerase family protein [Stieleria sp. HD01]